MNDSLTIWLERWLGVDPAGPGEGTVWSLENSWSWAPWVSVLFALFVVALVALLYVREVPGRSRLLLAFLVLTRLCALALVLMMIAQLVLALKRTGLPSAALIIDESASMETDDRFLDEKLQQSLGDRTRRLGFDKASRLNLAKMVLLDRNEQLLRKLRQDYQLRVYYISGDARTSAESESKLADEIKRLQPTGESSQLGHGLRTVLNDLRGTQPAAIVILSDGITTEGESLSEVAAYARRQAVPIYTVTMGSDQPLRDLEVNGLLVDEVAFVNDIVQFEFNLTGQGYAGERVDVVLREKSTSEPIAQTKVAITGDGQPQKVRIPYRPTAVGEFEYTVEALPRGDESNPDNNRQTRVISVRKEQIRVLYVQSYPNFEYRYLKNMLERDGTIELKTVLQEADPEYSSEDKSALGVLPYRREELFDYDVIVFGDVNPGFLSSSVMDHLSDFVREKGGGLVFIAGPQFMPLAFEGTPLEPLLPIDLKSASSPAANESITDGFQLVPTDLGLASSPLQLGNTPEETKQIWQHLPPLYWYLQIQKLRPAARVLAEHPRSTLADGRRVPLVILEYAGAGKVLFHAFDETWRWRYQVGDIYLARYWIQTIRYLSRSKLLGKDRGAELIADRREYRRGEPVRLRVRFFKEGTAPTQDDGVTVVVQRDQRDQRSVMLRRVAANEGVFEGLLTQAGDGDYHAWMATPASTGKAPACDFLVSAPPGEFARLQMDRSEMERTAAQTGGKSYSLVTAPRLINDLPPGRQVPIDALPAIVLWNKWPVLLLFLALLISEWLVRKRIGLL